MSVVELAKEEGVSGTRLRGLEVKGLSRLRNTPEKRAVLEAFLVSERDLQWARIADHAGTLWARDEKKAEAALEPLFAMALCARMLSFKDWLESIAVEIANVWYRMKDDPVNETSEPAEEFDADTVEAVSAAFRGD